MAIKVYSTPTCPYCSMAKNFLKQNKIEFEDIDVATNTEAAREIVAKSGQMAVPVLDIDGTIIVGADLGAIKKALHLEG